MAIERFIQIENCCFKYPFPVHSIVATNRTNQLLQALLCLISGYHFSEGLTSAPMKRTRR